MSVVSIAKPKFLILNSDLRGCKFLGEYTVECRIYDSGHIQIDKVFWYSERFQFSKDITVDIIPKSEELESLKDQISDWYIGYQLEQMNKKREFNNDDPNPAA